MCGIAGVITWVGLAWSGEALDAMLQTMRLRGPDHQGHRRIGGADLGSCRLAIQDLSPAGHQPMLNETGTVAVVFNGEIYNAPDLRAQLVSAGHRFIGHSDTEVLVHGYEEWGIDGLHERCDGMWAFALWDQSRHVAYLSRDRCGEKPLFYSHRDGELWFGSTIGSMLASRGRSGVPAYRPEIVLEYLACGYVPPDRCVFEGIEKLPPACYLEATVNGLTCRRYWHLRYDARDDADLATLEEQLDALLDRAVAQCLIADVPLGAFLSGGTDSSLVVAMMARHQRRPRTFTMRVPGTERDEGHYARAVAERYQTEHVEIPLGSECVDALPELAMAFGEPFADSSCIPAYFVSREIRTHVTVVLGGDGGDEGFGGYRGVPYLESLERLHRSGAAALHWPRSQGWAQGWPASRLLEWVDGRSGAIARGVRATAYASDFSVYLRNLCLLGPAQAAGLIGPALSDATFEDWCRPFAAAFDADTGSPLPRHWYQRGLAAGLHAQLAGDFLVKIDTTTMGHSVEARSPFLSRAVLEFAARLPASAIANREGDKVLLKRLARRLVPVECVDRLKSGFSVPLERWIAGPWGRLSRELLSDSLAVREGLLAARGVDRLLRRAPVFEYRWASIVFSVLMLELWLRLVAKRTDSVDTLRDAIARPVAAASAAAATASAAASAVSATASASASASASEMPQGVPA
jgi:asparagine synthase (glutamine-hydrolysing)